MTRTVAELTKELAILEQALADTRKVAAGRATKSYQVQALQTKVILGQADQHELLAAQQEVDRTVEALIKIPDLEQSVVDQQRMIESVTHRDRSEFVQRIKDDFNFQYGQYEKRCKDTLLLFRMLQTIDNQYRSLARAGELPDLLAPFHRELNLPAITGPLSGRANFTTGQE